MERPIFLARGQVAPFRPAVVLRWHPTLISPADCISVTDETPSHPKFAAGIQPRRGTADSTGYSVAVVSAGVIEWGARGRTQ